ncbi:MAG: RodZ domain-containing protein [Pseudomonadota bacterium]
MAQDSSHNRTKTHESVDHDAGQSLGSYLQRERLKKQLTIEQVAEETCIHIATLRAIENNDRTKMPAEVFSRGFIKLYAAHLGLNPQEILERYIREMSVVDEAGIHTHDIFYNEKLAESSSFFFSSKKIIFLLVLAVLAALGYYFFFYGTTISPYHSMLSVPEEGTNPSVEEQINQALTSLEKSNETQMDSSTYSNGDMKTDAQTAIPSSPSGEIAAPPEVNSSADVLLPQNEIVTQNSQPLPVTAPQPASSQPTPDQVAPPATKGKITLHIVFSERTWMQATIDDQTSRNYLFDPGAESRWDAENRIKLFIGNSGGVKIFVNDRELSLSGKSGTPIRLTIPDDIPPE